MHKRQDDQYNAKSGKKGDQYFHLIIEYAQSKQNQRQGHEKQQTDERN